MHGGVEQFFYGNVIEDSRRVGADRMTGKERFEDALAGMVQAWFIHGFLPMTVCVGKHSD
jgi:hypothetical protein